MLCLRLIYFLNASLFYYIKLLFLLFFTTSDLIESYDTRINPLVLSLFSRPSFEFREVWIFFGICGILDCLKPLALGLLLIIAD